jgi:hypothetical protein
MNSHKPSSMLKRLWWPLLLCVFSILGSGSAKAQEKPPRPITVRVSTARHLQFGSFIQTGNNGTVTVDYSSARSATGSIILPNISSSAFPTSALFIVDAEPGTLITIFNGSDAILTGSNSGTLTLKIGDSSTGSPFITQSQYTDVFIGGTLIVGPLSANPAGSYSGTFTVTFIQQ